MKRTPRESLKRGMVLISEDRRGQALINLTVRKNVVLSTLDRYARVGVMDGKREIRDTEGQIGPDIKTKGAK